MWDRLSSLSPDRAEGQSHTMSAAHAMEFMLRQLAMIRASTILLVWLVITLTGCTAEGRRGVAPRDGQSGPPPDVDRARAHMPLSRIEPLPSKPVRPDSLKPLSERAAGQIATARGLIEEQRYTEAAIELPLDATPGDEAA